MAKRILSGLLALLLLVALSACSGKNEGPGNQNGGQNAGQAASLKVAYIPVDASTPLIVAAEKFAPEQNLKVELIKVNSGGEALTQVSTGNVQVGIGALGASGFNALQQGLPVKYVMPGHYDWPTNTFVVAKNIKSPADLKGKKVAVNARGVASELELDISLRRWGLTLKDVEVVTMPFPDMPAAMENGSIAGGCLTEPIATLVEEKGIGYRPFPHDPNDKVIPITMIFYNSDWASKNRDVAVRFAAAYLKAARYLEQDGGKGWLADDVLQIREKYFNLKPDLAKKARPTKITPDLSIDLQSLQEQQQFNKDMGYLKYDKLMNVEQYVDLSFVEEARKLAQ